MTLILDFGDIVAASERIAPYIHRTPVLSSSYIDAATGTTVIFKCENLQKVGAFKARGALNAVLSLEDAETERGVVTHSSGNHGQAVAYACAVRDIPATVVMPDHASPVKVAAVKDYGAQIVFCAQPDREQVLADVVASSGAVVVHPFDDAAVVAGQGTAALELVGQVPNLDVIVAPIGGGGLLSGTALVALANGVVAVGAEPEVVDDAFRSLRDGVRYGPTGALSVGDGLLTGIGEIPFAILRDAEVQILTVSEIDILKAMRMLAVRTKLVVEPSGATAVAALLSHRDQFAGKRVAVVLSGGNVSMDLFAS
jgi:threonine dehydratase